MEDNEKYFFAGDSKGDELLRSAIANYLHRERGVNCDTEQIILGAGNEYLLLLLSQLLESRQVVAMERYTYIQAARAFINMKYQVSDSELSIIEPIASMEWVNSVGYYKNMKPI